MRVGGGASGGGGGRVGGRVRCWVGGGEGFGWVVGERGGEGVEDVGEGGGRGERGWKM